MALTIWRTKVHPGAGHLTQAGTDDKPLHDPKVIAVDVDSSGDISVWFQHDPDGPTMDADHPAYVPGTVLHLTAVPTGGQVPDGFVHVGSATLPTQPPRHVYARTTLPT